MKKALLIAGAMLGFLVTIGLMNASNTVFAASRDCSTNSIVHCGVLSVSEMQQKYSENQPGDLDEIYAHYGITSADMNNTSLIKEGTTYKDGRVVVDGQTVATDAASLGRNKKSGDHAVTIAGKTYWEGTNQTAFRSDALEVFVFMNEDGTFKAAIIKSCGNPLKANPTPKPEQPKPEQPKPEQPKPEQPKPKPAPVYTCESLISAKINRTTYRFIAEADASNGATVVDYIYDFGDGTTQEVNDRNVRHEYAEPGDYTATVTAVVDVNGTTENVTSDSCTVEVTVAEKPVREEPKPCPIEGKENLPADSEKCVEDKTPAVIPSTGIGSIVSGLMGASSIGAASYYYVRSRRLL